MVEKNEVDELEFEFEFYAEGLDSSTMEEELRLEADSRLRELADGQRDMIGASVAVEKPVEAETGFVYRARVVVYIKPENMVAVEKEENPVTALKQALDAVERQVHEHRQKVSEPWKKPEAGPEDHIV